MKLLLVSSGSGSRGGGEIFLDYLGKGLSDRGHQVMMWIPNHRRMDELSEKCARFACVIRSEYRNTYDYVGRSLSTQFNWHLSRRIAREWEALGPDLIHINKQNMEDGLDLLRAAESCSVPSVCTIHLTQTAHYLKAKGAWLRDWIAHRALIEYHGIFVLVQEARRAALVDFLGGRVRTRTVFNGVPSVNEYELRRLRPSIRKKLDVRDNDLLVLGIGRLAEQKRPMLFLDIAAELSKRLSAVKFVWIGDGKLSERWKDEVVRRQLEKVVSCIGWQPDVQSFLCAGDLLLHVAEFEGLPFAVIEAMAAGLPCAITRALASEVPHFDDKNVLFVDNLDVLAIKLSDPGALARVVAAGRHLVAEWFSLERMVESYERIYADATV